MNATLLISCPDQSGIIAAVTGFLAEHRANIIDLDEHVDRDAGTFFMRVEWPQSGFGLDAETFRMAFAPLAAKYTMSWDLHESSRHRRLGILVSRQSHCLYDLLARTHSGEWDAEIGLVIGNHNDLERVARQFETPFHFLPVGDDSAGQEKAICNLLSENEIDTVILAKYMRVLSKQCLDAYPNAIINIHHSFLPAFAGARPYHAAHARGVKVIGATSHYVTEELDQGPIIEQDVISVTHKDSVEDLVRKGRDLEKIVLARAVWHHLNTKVLVHGNRTIVFK